MKFALTLAIATLATLTACATPNLDDPAPLPISDPGDARGSGRSSSTSPSPSSSGSGDVMPSPAPAPAPTSDPSVNAGRNDKRWKGALPATTPVQFGGGQTCVYRITLKDVKVDILAAASGDIAAATVTAVAFEETLGASCNTPIPAHTHTYVLVLASVLPNGTGHLELVGVSTNHPAASLVIEGDFTSPSPALSLAWHRTDYGPPLDWRVNAQITASLQP